MKNDLFFRTNQAAQELGTAAAAVRALCKAGKIRCETTEGGQLRIPQSEVERLKADGVPAAPRPLPAPAPPGGSLRSSRPPGLLASPSHEVIQSSEDVFKLQNEVALVDLQRKKEEGLDWFRDRQQRQASQAAQLRREEEQQREQAHQAEERRTFISKWMTYALEQMPAFAPESLRIDVHRHVDETISRLDLAYAEPIVRQIVDAAVAAAVEPWQAEERRRQAVEEASSGFANPWLSSDTEWVGRAALGARDAISRLPAAASESELKAVTVRSALPLRTQYEHTKLVDRLLNAAKLRIPYSVSTEEREETIRALSAVVDSLGPHASEHQIQNALEPIVSGIVRFPDERKVRESVLSVAVMFLPLSLMTMPERRSGILEEIRATLATAHTKEEMQRAADRVTQRITRIDGLVDAGEAHIEPFVKRLSRDYDLGEQPSTIAWRMKQPVREALWEDLEGTESAGQVQELVEHILEEQLNIEP